MPGNTAIAARGLTKSFGRLTAVDRVDLEIGEGEFFGLLGPNGAGKTTLIRMLVCLCVPTAGSAAVFGRDVVKDHYGVKEMIGVVPQDFNFDDTMTARDVLTFHGGYFGMPRADRERRADELLEFLGLKEKENAICTKLSGGMKHRLLIGRALMQRPKVLFLDEPTTGVDVQLRRSLWDMMKRLNREGTTIVLTTHYIEEAEHLCDRVAIMDHGRIIALGAPEELKRTTSGDGLLEIEVEGEPLADLKSLPGVRRVWWKDGTLSVRVVDADTAAIRVLDRLRAAGVPVKAMRVQEASLEDVFIRLTGRELRE